MENQTAQTPTIETLRITHAGRLAEITHALANGDWRPAEQAEVYALEAARVNAERAFDRALRMPVSPAAMQALERARMDARGALVDFHARIKAADIAEAEAMLVAEVATTRLMAGAPALTPERMAVVAFQNSLDGIN